MTQKGKFRGAVADVLRTLQTSQQPSNAIYRFLSTAKVSDLLPFAHEIAANTRLSPLAIGIPFPASPEQAYHRRPLYVLTLGRELYWTACELRLFSAKLGGFLHLQINFSRSVRRQDWQAAETILNEIEQEYGYSLWLLENRLAVYEFLNGINSQKAYAAPLIADDRLHPNLRLIIYGYSLRAERSISPDRYESLLGEQMPVVFETSSIIGQFVAFHLNFFGHVTFPDHARILSLNRNLSLIDRYLGFIRVSQLILSSQPSTSALKYLAKALALLIGRYSDDRIVNLLSVAGLATEATASTVSKAFLTTVEHYTRGDYAEVMLAAKTPLASENSHLDFFELVAMASAHSPLAGAMPNSEPWLVDKMKSVLLKLDKHAEAFLELLKLAFTFQSLPWAAQLFSFLMREYDYATQSLPPRFATFGDLNALAWNPRLSLSLPTQTLQLRHLDNIDRALGITITSRLYRALVKGDIADIRALEGASVPRSRIEKYAGRAAFTLGEFDVAEESFRSLLAAGGPVNLQDAYDGLIYVYIGANKAHDLVALIANVAVDTPGLRARIPFDKALDYLESCPRIPLYYDIGVPVLYDLSFNVSALERETSRAIVYEDFMSGSTAERPSRLRATESQYPKNILIYFLRYVCVPNILDGSIAFASTDEIVEERIAVCQWLTELDASNASVYADEIREATQRQIVSKGVRVVEQSRIYVDIVGLKRATESDSRESFARYQDLAKFSKDIDEVTEFVLELEKLLADSRPNLRVVLPGNQYMEAFRQWVRLLRDAFVSNNEYGLDGYLSVGIRHGTLSGQLRSPFERAKLITLRDETGRYGENEHWARLCKDYGLNEAQNREVQTALQELSHNVDSTIERLRSQDLQIRTEERKTSGLFDFRLSGADLRSLQGSISAVQNHDEALDLALEFLWKLADRALERIVHVLSGYKREFAGYLDAIQTRLGHLTGAFSASELDDAIAMARTGIQEATDVVAGWFTRSKVTTLADFPLSLPIDIGVQIMNNIYPWKQLEPIRKIGTDALFVGTSLKALSHIFHILFENAFKYSNTGQRPPRVLISAETSAKKLLLKVENEVCGDQDRAAIESRLAAIRIEIEKGATSDTFKKEGGTGIHKIAKLLRVDLRCEAKLEFGFDYQTFYVSIAASGGNLFS